LSQPVIDPAAVGPIRPPLAVSLDPLQRSHQTFAILDDRARAAAIKSPLDGFGRQLRNGQRRE